MTAFLESGQGQYNEAGSHGISVRAFVGEIKKQTDMKIEIKVNRNDLNVYYQGKKVLKYAVLNDFVKLVWSKKAFVNYCACEVWQIEDEITEKYDKPIQRTR